MCFCTKALELCALQVEFCWICNGICDCFLYRIFSLVLAKQWQCLEGVEDSVLQEGVATGEVAAGAAHGALEAPILHLQTLASLLPSATRSIHDRSMEAAVTDTPGDLEAMVTCTENLIEM